MKALTRAEILNANDTQKEKVECPEWGGYVYVKALTGTERDAWENSLFELKPKPGRESEITFKRENIRARFCAISVVDESGTLMFAPADIEALGKKSARALDRIFSVAQRLSGLSNTDLEELEKNLTKTPADTSTSN